MGISHIKGIADVKMELAEADRPRRAQYKGQGSVAGGNVSVVATFDLMPVRKAVPRLRGRERRRSSAA